MAGVRDPPFGASGATREQTCDEPREIPDREEQNQDGKQQRGAPTPPPTHRSEGGPTAGQPDANASHHIGGRLSYRSSPPTRGSRQARAVLSPARRSA